MRSQLLTTSLLAFVLLFATIVSAADSTSKDSTKDSLIDRVKWQKGPSSGTLGNLAQIKIPEKYIFAGGEDTKLLMEVMQNPVSGRELGFLAPEKASWFIVFEFDDTGYIRDDEKGSLDAAAMLESIKAGNAEGNKERTKRGWPKLDITGWEQQPHYDEKTNNLEWAIRGQSEGRPVVNFNISDPWPRRRHESNSGHWPGGAGGHFAAVQDCSGGFQL